MKPIPLANTEIFEFQSTDEIIKSTHDTIQNTKFHYVYNGSTDVNMRSANGYRDLGNGEITFFYHKPLFDWVNECLKLVTDKYFFYGNLQICDSWVVKTKLGQISPKHFHTCSVFSGLFYVTEHDSSETVFYGEDPVHKHFSPYYGETVKQNNVTYISKPKPGKLLVWPSYLEHQVNMHREKTIRYTVAFNTDLTGYVSPMRTCYTNRSIQEVSNPESIKISPTKKYIPT